MFWHENIPEYKKEANNRWWLTLWWQEIQVLAAHLASRQWDSAGMERCFTAHPAQTCKKITFSLTWFTVFWRIKVCFFNLYVKRTFQSAMLSWSGAEPASWPRWRSVNASDIVNDFVLQLCGNSFAAAPLCPNMTAHKAGAIKEWLSEFGGQETGLACRVLMSHTWAPSAPTAEPDLTKAGKTQQTHSWSWWRRAHWRNDAQ